MAQDVNELSSSVFLFPYGEMTADFSIIADEDQDLTSKIRVTTFSELSSTIYAFANIFTEHVNGQLRHGYQIKSKLHVLSRENVVSRLQVSPNGSMVIVAEVNPIPVHEVVAPGAQDTYVYSAVPTLNYAEEHSLLVGYFADEFGVARTLIQFDLSFLHPEYLVISAILQMHHDNSFGSPMEINIHTVDRTWNAQGVTWLNRPLPDQYITSFSVQSPGFVRINLLDLVKDWQDGSAINRGLFLISNNETNQILELKSTETVQSALVPKLIVSYHDPNEIYSQGQSFLDASVLVLSRNNVKSKIRVKEIEELVSRLQVGRNGDVAGKLFVHRPLVNAKIMVREVANLSSTLYVNTLFSRFQLQRSKLRVTWFTQIDSRLSILPHQDVHLRFRVMDRTNMLSKVKVTAPNEITSTLMVRATHDLSSKLFVSYQKTITSTLRVFESEDLTYAIHIPYREDVTSLITVRGIMDNPCRIHVTDHQSLASLIGILPREDMTSKLTIPMKPGDSELFAHASVLYREDLTTRMYVIPYLSATMKVGYDDANQLTSRIIVPPPKDAMQQLNSKIRIPMYNAFSQILIGKIKVPRYQDQNDLIGLIRVTESRQLISRGLILYRQDLPAHVEVWYASMIPSQIKISQPGLASRMFIPFYDESTRPSRIQIARRFISERPSIIRVTIFDQVYSVIQVTVPFDILAVLGVSIFDDVLFSMDVQETKDMQVTFFIPYETRLPSHIAVTRSEDVASSMQVFVPYDISGAIQVFENKDLYLRLRIGHLEAYGFIM